MKHWILLMKTAYKTGLTTCKYNTYAGHMENSWLHGLIYEMQWICQTICDDYKE